MPQSAKTPCRSLRSVTQFIIQFIRHPSRVGAICPSSQQLCKHMAAAALAPLAKSTTAPRLKPQPIVELGPGTGVVTRALIHAGAQPEQLICIENNPNFAKCLREEFTQLRMIQDSATHLEKILQQLNIAKVPVIVSSLPLLSIPEPSRQQIIQSIIHSLAPGGRLIQFTYGVSSPLQNYHDLIKPISKRFIPFNLPPAFVWEYQRSSK